MRIEGHQTLAGCNSVGIFVEPTLDECHVTQQARIAGVERITLLHDLQRFVVFAPHGQRGTQAEIRRWIFGKALDTVAVCPLGVVSATGCLIRGGQRYKIFEPGIPMFR